MGRRTNSAGCAATIAAVIGGLGVTARAQNLIVNGDFEAGNSGFLTDYQFATFNSVEGEYTVSNNPGGFNGAFQMPVSPAPATQMMVVNGATVPGLRVWRQSVGVSPGAAYRLRVLGYTGVAGGPAVLQFSVNGVEVGPALTLSPQPGEWRTLEAEWTAGAGVMSAQVVIDDLNTATFPNDFYLDNITMVELPRCGTSDYNGDGDFGTDADIEAFFACLSGACCGTCWENGSDFNGDGDFGTDADIEAFFRVLAGGNC
jgi:hypothetical protein